MLPTAHPVRDLADLLTGDERLWVQEEQGQAATGGRAPWTALSLCETKCVWVAHDTAVAKAECGRFLAWGGREVACPRPYPTQATSACHTTTPFPYCRRCRQCCRHALPRRAGLGGWGVAEAGTSQGTGGGA